MGDLLLAHPPAQQHVLPLTLVQEVDETRVEILDHPAQLLDAFDAACDRRRLLLDSALHLGDLLWGKVATVPGDALRQLHMLGLRLGESHPMALDPLHEDADGRKYLVRFLDGEIPGLVRHGGTVAFAAMRRIAILGLLAALALGASACGERPEPTGATVKLFPATVSRPDESPIVLDHAPQRVLVLTPAAVSLVEALEQGASSGPTIVTASGVGPNQLPPDIRSHRPDVVIASNSAENSALAQAAKVASVYVLPQGSIREAERGIVESGALLGRPLQARRLIAQIQRQRTAVERKVESLPRTSVFLDNGFFTTFPSHSLAGDIVSEAGGKSVAGANHGPGPFDVGLLHRRNPDVYLATSDSGVTLKDLRKNKRTRDLRAVRDGHFGIVQASNLQPGPDIGTGLLAVAKLLHPDAFG